MKKGSLSYEAIQSMLLEKMQERGCSTVSVTLCRYVSNSIFRMMKDLGYKEYCKEGASKVLNAYLNHKGANQYYSNLKTTIHRMDDLLDGTWKERHGPGRRQFSLARDQAGAIEEIRQALLRTTALSVNPPVVSREQSRLRNTRHPGSFMK